MTTPCLRCGQDFARKPGRGRPAQYCGPCRPLRTAQVKADQYRTAREEVLALHEIAERLRPQLTPSEWLTLVDYLAGLDTSPGDGFPLVPDRMPSGYLTDAGPDVGVSTGYADLRTELAERRRVALADPWWADNPHWTADI